MIRSSLLAVVVSMPLHAGVVYDFTTTIDAPRTSETVNGHVSVEGDSYRAEIRRRGVTSIVISRDRDQTATFLDSAARTYSNRSRAAGGDVRSSSLFLFPVAGARISGKPSVIYRRGGVATIAGRSAVRHDLDVRIDLESKFGRELVRGSVTARAVFWAAEELPELPMRSGVRTGYFVVDREVEEALQAVRGMILRHHLEVTRTMAGGPPQTEVINTTVTRLEELDLDPTLFEVPDHYVYVGPVTGTD